MLMRLLDIPAWTIVDGSVVAGAKLWRRRAVSAVMRTLLAVLTAVAVSMTVGAEAQAAATLRVEVRPPTPGTVAAPNPVAVAVQANLEGGLPGSVQMLSVAMPDGFATALAGTSTCSAAQLQSGGSAACPASSKLGSGSADFTVRLSPFALAGSTEEAGVFRGEGDVVLLYVRIERPAAVKVVLPGTLTARAAPLGPLLTFDLRGIAAVARQYGGGTGVAIQYPDVALTRASFELTRGLAAGPCPDGLWRFSARLRYNGDRFEDIPAQAPCTAPDTAAPTLRATASDGPRARGALLRVRLSEAATVRVTLERRAGGRWAKARQATFRTPAGASNLAIRRVNGRALAPGRYRARLRATDAVGLSSPKRAVTFVLRAARRA